MPPTVCLNGTFGFLDRMDRICRIYRIQMERAGYIRLPKDILFILKILLILFSFFLCIPLGLQAVLDQLFQHLDRAVESVAVHFEVLG